MFESDYHLTLPWLGRVSAWQRDISQSLHQSSQTKEQLQALHQLLRDEAVVNQLLAVIADQSILGLPRNSDLVAQLSNRFGHRQLSEWLQLLNREFNQEDLIWIGYIMPDGRYTLLIQVPVASEIPAAILLRLYAEQLQIEPVHSNFKPAPGMGLRLGHHLSRLLELTAYDESNQRFAIHCQQIIYRRFNIHECLALCQHGENLQNLTGLPIPKNHRQQISQLFRGPILRQVIPASSGEAALLMIPLKQPSGEPAALCLWHQDPILLEVADNKTDLSVIAAYLNLSMVHHDSISRTRTQLQQQNRSLQRQLEQERVRLEKTEQDLKMALAKQDRMLFDSMHDPLTDCPNRAMFTERLVQVIRGNRSSTAGVAVMLLELTNLTQLSDQLGQRQIDQLLKKVATQLTQVLPEGDMLARFAPDQFAILANSASLSQGYGNLIEKIMAVMDIKLQQEGIIIPLESAIGYTYLGQTEESIDILFQRASLALARARLTDGHKTIAYQHLFTSELLQQDPSTPEQRLAQALAKREIQPFFQPIIQLRDNKLLGFEVVARWNQSSQEICASEFIPLAQRSGLITELDRQILQQASEKMQQWLDETGIEEPLLLSFNLSSFHLEQPSLTQELINLLDHLPLPNNNIVIEFSERELHELGSAALNNLIILRNSGLKLALDNFTMGHNSLQSLAELPVELIKVHENFTHHMTRSELDLSLLRAVRDLSHDLGFEVIANGVETDQQLKLLVEMGCDYGQGHFIAQPMELKDLNQLLV